VLFSAVLFVAVERPFLDLREKVIAKRSLAGAPAMVTVDAPVGIPVVQEGVTVSAPASAPTPAQASPTVQSQDTSSEV
jgi:hypothetical protein